MRSAPTTQSPEQGGGCRCLPNLPDSSWFSLSTCICSRLIPSAGIRLLLALAARQPPFLSWLRTFLGVAVHTPLHSPRGSAVRRRASGPPLPPLSSWHSSHPARITAARIAVNLCPVRTAPRYTCLLYTSDAADEEDSVDL